MGGAGNRLDAGRWVKDGERWTEREIRDGESRGGEQGWREQRWREQG